ncbi:MAG: hypothetical protein Kow0090_14990 [Myxococcota bacterium]
MKKILLIAFLLSVFFLFVACGDDADTSGDDVNDVDDTADADDDDATDDNNNDDTLEEGELDISICDPANGHFSLNIDNPYFPLPVGKKLILEGKEGSTVVRVEFRVLDETEEVAGVTTRVVEEYETEDDEVVEVSRNFFAQAPDGTVCYFGEDVYDYEGGDVVGSSGEWRAGDGGSKAGVIMPANPEVGMEYQQEYAPGVAMDRGEIMAVGETVEVPAGTFENTLRVKETSPLDFGSSKKIYEKGIGMIVDDSIELISYE